MLHVELDSILTEEDALGQIKHIFERVENEQVTYVITRNGRPALAIVDITTLEQGTAVAVAPAPQPQEEPFVPLAAEEPLPPSQPSVFPNPAPISPVIPEEAPQPTFAPAEPLPPLPDFDSTALSSPAVPAADPVMPPLPGVGTVPPPPAPEPVASAYPEPAASPMPSAPQFPQVPSMPEPDTDLNNSSPLA